MASSAAAVPPPASPGNDANTASPERFFESRVVPFCCRTLACGTVVFTLTYFFAILLWVPLHPNPPKLNLTSATLSISAVTAASAAAECNATFVITNTNRHLTALFDRIEISLLYPSKKVVLSRTSLPPIVQPKRSTTPIEGNLSFNGVNLGIDVVKAMKSDFNGGSITLGIKVFARARYRHGKWETRGEEMWAYCTGLSFAFPSRNMQGSLLNPYRECEVCDYEKSD